MNNIITNSLFALGLITLTSCNLLSQDKKETKTPINPHEVGVYDTDLLPASFHTDRREQLRNLMPDSSVAIFFSAPIRNRSNDVDFEYHPDPNFYYLTGWNEPHAVLLLFSTPQIDDERSSYITTERGEALA